MTYEKFKKGDRTTPRSSQDALIFKSSGWEWTKKEIITSLDDCLAKQDQPKGSMLI